MGSSEELADAVKRTILSDNATPATVATLQALLRTEPDEQGDISARNPTKAKEVARSRSRIRNNDDQPAQSDGRRKQKFKIHEDGPKPLSPKAKREIATNVVNAALKTLSDSSRPVPKPAKVETVDRNFRASSPKTTKRPSIYDSSISARPLGDRSQNPITESQPSETDLKTRRTSSRSICANAQDISAHVRSVAECGRLGFSYLLSNENAKSEAQHSTNFQLETGLIVFIGKLINHGLDCLALQELRVVKRRLEAIVLPATLTQHTKRAATIKSKDSERENLASFLELNIDSDRHPSVLPLLNMYHVIILRLISIAPKSSTISELLKILQAGKEQSPVAVVMKQSRQSSDPTKAAKQLQNLSQLLFGLCPSLSASRDVEAQDTRAQAPPVTSFKLQIVALSIQKLATSLGGKTEPTHHWTELFSKSVAALIRRASAHSSAVELYTAVNEGYNSLLPLSEEAESARVQLALFEILRNLSILAEQAGLLEKSHKWATLAFETCKTLETNHSRRVAILTRKATIWFRLHRHNDDTVTDSPDLATIECGLEARTPGSVSDHENLLNELSNLMQAVERTERKLQIPVSKSSLVRLAVGFATRFVRSYTPKGLSSAKAIVNAGLIITNSTEDRAPWVTSDVVGILIQSGDLRGVCAAASNKPLTQAWSSSTPAIALSFVLKALLLKTARSDAGSRAGHLYDDTALQEDERATLLEWQLKLSIDLAHQSRDFEVRMPKVIQDILEKLDILYRSPNYPIRRARVAVSAMRLREEFSNCLSHEVLERWTGDNEINDSQLKHDEGLRDYLIDIKATTAIAKAFYHESPQFSTIEPVLLEWCKLCETAKDSGSANGFIDDPNAWLSTLESLNDYVESLDESASWVLFAEMQVKFGLLYAIDSSKQLEHALRLSRAYLSIGHSERAGNMLETAKGLVASKKPPDLIGLQYHLSYAEYLLSVDDVRNARRSLEMARQSQQSVESQQLRSSQRKTYKLLHGRSWLAHSKLLLATGVPHEALHTAKLAVKSINSIWLSLERSGSIRNPELANDTSDADSPAMRGLTAGVSKLNLKPTTETARSSRYCDARGPETWKVVPLLWKSLLHLSDLFAYHGVYPDARYYSDRAMDIAEAIPSQELVARIGCHRSLLLAAGGELDEAELCLAKIPENENSSPSLMTIQRLRTKASLHCKEGCYEEAFRKYEAAEQIVKLLQSIPQPPMSGPTTAPAIWKEQGHIRHGDALVMKSSKIDSKPKTRGVKALHAKGKKVKTDDTDVRSQQLSYILRKIHAQIILDKGLVAFRLGYDSSILGSEQRNLLEGLPGSSIERQLEHYLVMQKVTGVLQADFTFNVLPESTLCLPALMKSEMVSDKPSELRITPQEATKKRGPKQPGPKKVAVAETLEMLLSTTRNNLWTHTGQCGNILTTSETHLEFSMLSNATMLLSTASRSNLQQAVSPLQQALVLEAPKINASECYTEVARSDAKFHRKAEQPLWPTAAIDRLENTLTAETFREMYVDILPSPWTVVSMSLNDACDELFVTRYRRGMEPLILRLPFARHKPGGEDDEPFDFRSAKAELQDIIERSNYTCHSSGDAGSKGAKVKWWSEREALDKQLHELLMNIESIWLGGFKGIFSQRTRDSDLFARFRQAFESILDGHLPSRRVAKRNPARLVLHDQILDLFIGLGVDSDYDDDLDEPLSDLLYFVVDMLQFNGEQNAYDEIDFDNMSVEVLDALRSYHEGRHGEHESDSHLILVLDRRLQAFPWESLPCLEGSSTSRVDSLRSVRERIQVMRQRSAQSPSEDGYYAVPRRSGTYILNPSGDLQNTEKSLGPVLSKLADDAAWTAISGKAPSQDGFKSAVSNSSTLLYFGHGAGTQYVGTRSIRRLERCSEVVWLVGCSSGAVNEHGDLEPSAVPLAYLAAGHGTPASDEVPQNTDASDHQNKSPEPIAANPQMCMAVMAMLWDITDKDIDRFSLAVGEEWGLWKQAVAEAPAKVPAKASKKRAAMTDPPSTPRAPFKTPKTPRVRNTPATMRTPARNRVMSAEEQARKRSLVEAVSMSRDCCYLRYLNGAAPVVYGVPIYLGD